MDNRELAEKIAADLFTPSGGDGSHPKAKQLRLYSEFNPHGRYISGWSESAMATRIEYLLGSANGDAAGKPEQKIKGAALATPLPPDSHVPPHVSEVTR